MLYTVRQHKKCAPLGLLKEIGRHRNVSEIYLTVVQRTICCRQSVVGFYFLEIILTAVKVHQLKTVSFDIKENIC